MTADDAIVTPAPAIDGRTITPDGELSAERFERIKEASAHDSRTISASDIRFLIGMVEDNAADANYSDEGLGRAQLRCSHYPVCPDFQSHQAQATRDEADKERQVAEVIRGSKMAERLARFIPDRMDPSVTALTSARELWAISEMIDGERVCTHFIVIPVGAENSTCVSLHADGNTRDCPDAVCVALWTSLSTSLRETP